MGSSASTDPSSKCLRQQSVLADLGERALASDDLDRLFDDAAAAVVETVDADRCGVFESPPAEGTATMRAGIGWESPVGDDALSTAPETHLGTALRARRPVVTDVAADADSPGPGPVTDRDGGSAIGVAVGRPVEPWGVLCAYAPEPDRFTDQDAEFLRCVANVLGAAVETERARSDVEEVYGRISDAVFALDEEWEFTYLNDRARELIAPDGEELVGETIWEEFPEADDREFRAQYERAMTEQVTVSFEEYYPEPVDAWFEVRAYPSESGLSVYFRDVTERRRAQQRLAEERDIFAQGPITVFRWEAAEGWPVEYVSENVEEAFGYAPEELESGAVSYTDLLLDEEIDRIAREVDEAIDAEAERFSHDPYRVRCEDGEVRWVKDVTKVIRNDRGEISHYLGYLVDITERKERERELSQYEAIVEAVEDGVYVVDDEGRFRMVNEAYAEMTGYDREDLIGEHASLVVDDEVRDRAREAEVAMRDGETEAPVIEAKVETASGERIPMETRFALLPDGDGLRVGVVRDVSERVEREQELNRYERIIENLPVGVYRNTPGPDGEFVAANQTLARIFDADSVEEFMEYGVSDLYADPEERAEFSRTLEREGMVEDVELRQETLSGETIWISVTAIEVEEDGEVYFDGVVQDVTDRKIREGELERTERRFEAIFEDPNILVGLLEPDGTVLDINQTAMEYIDADLESVTGEPFWETPWWGEGDDVQSDVMEWTERAAAGEYVDFEADLTRPDGQRYTLNGAFRPVTNEEGDVVSVIVSDRDVTERREYERRLEESERRYRTIADYFPNGIVTLFDHDLDYTLAAGQGFANLPVDPDDLEGNHFSAVWGEETAADLEPVFQGALAGEERSVELTYRGRDWVVHGAPITDERGEVFAGMTMARDITERKERERELAKYETIVETMDDGIYVKDEDGYFTMVNEAYAELTGYDREELVGEHASLVVDEETLQQSQNRDDEAADVASDAGDRSNEPMEATIQRADGGTVPTEGTFAELETGDERESIGVVRDITERKEQRRRIEESERRYRTLVENFPDGAVGLYDDDLRYTAVGGELLEQAGIAKEERIGDGVYEIYPDDVIDQIEPYFQAALEGEKSSFDIEYHDRYLHAHTLPVRNGNGEVFAGMLVVQDVTERREAEHELRQSEARFRMLAENIEEVVWMGAPAGDEFIYVNPAFEEVWGIDREHLYEEPLAFLDLVHPADRDHVAERFEALPDEEFDDEFRISRPDGEVRWVHAKGSLVHDEDAEMVRLVGTGQDVTERVERERRLEESERRYRTLAEHFPNGAVGVYDRDLQYTLAEGAMLGETLPTAAELEGQRVLDVFPSETVADLEPVFRAAVEDGETTNTTTEFGGRNWRVWATPLRNADGEIFAGLSFAQDITEQVERERELERALDLLERTEQIADVAGWEVDPETQQPYWSDHLFDLLDVDYDEQPTIEQALDVYESEEDSAIVDEAISEALDSGEPFDVVARFPRPEGDVGRLRVQGEPVVEDGEVVSLRGAVQDVTEQLERERELERALDLLERTEHIADVGGWEIDPETEDVFWTDHTFDLLEVEGEEEPTLEGALEMYHEEDRPLVEAAVENALATGDAFDVEVRLRTAASEKLRWLRLQGEPELVDGEVTSFRGAAQDVTERKHREQRLEELVEKLEESNERLEQFAYAASHDLQEPLRMVSSYLQLIERRYRDELDEDGEEFLRFAVDGADRMRDMIDGLLKYSRVDTRGDPLEPVDLDDVLADVREDLQVRIEESDAEITAESLPTVEGDAGQLRQVFQNLLDNAIEYSGDDAPHIDVSAERRGDMWAISVRDEGIGFNPEDADQVFDVFQSLHGSSEHSGTGIGLALCERIVERHGGDIWVDTEPGEGSTFTFTVPSERNQ